jgi:hypothetical protein
MHHSDSFSTLAKNGLICQPCANLGWVEAKKTHSILSLNLIPLGDLSGPSKGAFSQEGINLGFFLNLV